MIPFEAEVVARPNVSAPTIVVEALIVEDALETKPLENVRVVVVALLRKGYAMVLVMTPVAALYAMPAPLLKLLEEILFWKVVKSPLER